MRLKFLMTNLTIFWECFYEWDLLLKKQLENDDLRQIVLFPSIPLQRGNHHEFYLLTSHAYKH